MKTIEFRLPSARSMVRLVSCGVVFSAGVADAVPAQPGPWRLEQPDGQEISARVTGDEWCARVERLDGYGLGQDGQGSWRYLLDETGRLGPVAQLPPPRGLKRGIRMACTQVGPDERQHVDPAWTDRGTGEVPILFILAEFSDWKGHYTEQEFAGFISDEIATYYRSVSYGQMELVPADETFGDKHNGVVGWVGLDMPHPNTGSSIGVGNQKATWSALEAADPYVDFGAYDQNLDGYVDSDELAVVVIAAGHEASYGWPKPAVWGHAWNLDDVGTLTLDGVVVGANHDNRGGYTQFGEIHRSSRWDTGHQATMGIMVHELGHLIFRLPDLYDTDESSNGIGAWCLMSYGSWGWSLDDQYMGQTPVMPSAWIRSVMEWSDTVLTQGDVSLMATGDVNATSANTLVKASSSYTSQWFLVENRQPSGYDRGLERLLGTADFGGLAIWHVDEKRTSNRRDASRLVDLEEADGDTTAYKPTNLWVSGTSPARFDLNSSPNSNLNSGVASGVSMSGFSTSSPEMSLLVFHP